MLKTRVFNYIILSFIMIPILHGADLNQIVPALQENNTTLSEDAANEQYEICLYEFGKAFHDEMNKELNSGGYGCDVVMDSSRKKKILKIEFGANRRATIEEARALQLLIIKRLVRAANSNEKLQPFLEKKPFTHKQLRLTIYFRDDNNRAYSDGTVSAIYHSPDPDHPKSPSYLSYRSEDPFTELSYELLSESYQEALQANRNSLIEDPTIHISSEREKEMDRIILDFENQISRKHHFRSRTIGSNTSENVSGIRAHFDSPHAVTQAKARKLLLDVVEPLLQGVNTSQIMRPYFTVEKLAIQIDFFKYTSFACQRYRDGSMDSVVLKNGQITYFQQTPRNPEDYPNYIYYDRTVYAEESYLEAIDLAKKTRLEHPLLKTFFLKISRPFCIIKQPG